MTATSSDPALPPVHAIARRAAERWPNAVAITEGDTEMTYAQLWAAIRESARAMFEIGLGPGKRLLVTGPGGIETAVSVYAASLCGATISVSGNRYSDQQRGMIEASFEPHVILENGDRKLRLTRSFGGRTAEEDQPFLVVYTSGSSGRPGGVSCPHDAVSFSVDAIHRRLGYRPSDRILAIPPFSFDYGLYQIFLATMAGASLRIIAPGDGVATFTKAASCGPTVLPLLPALIRSCTALAERWPAHIRAGVRLITNTGAHLTDDGRAALRATFPRAALISMYGLTECKRTTVSEPNEDLSFTGTVGRSLPGTSVWIEGPDGRRCEPGEVGQIIVRGPNVMQGYWREADRTCEVFRPRNGERELITGDLGYLDPDGRLYVRGRRADQLKVRGTRVSAAEVALAASSVHGVAAAALVPGPPGHEPVLYVEGGVSAVQVRRQLGMQIGSWKVPDDIQIIDLLPINDRGKIDLAALRRLTGLPGEV